VRLLVLAAGLGIFVAVTLAVRFHFKAVVLPVRFLVLAGFALLNAIFFARELLYREPPLALSVTALGLFALSAALFGWTIWASRNARLKVIYHVDRPSRVLREGPYRYIRHPFYASYIPYWLGCAVATLHWVNMLFFVLVVPALIQAARREEEGFAKSSAAGEYADYKRQSGMFWPRLS
jgi:protein-S-isoprenylcysteine O-methyltransferase Ste14